MFHKMPWSWTLSLVIIVIFVSRASSFAQSSPTESNAWMSLRMRTTSRHGVLLHVASRDDRHECSIEVQEGRVHVRFAGYVGFLEQVLRSRALHRWSTAR